MASLSCIIHWIYTNVNLYMLWPILHVVLSLTNSFLIWRFFCLFFLDSMLWHYHRSWDNLQWPRLLSEPSQLQQSAPRLWVSRHQTQVENTHRTPLPVSIIHIFTSGYHVYHQQSRSCTSFQCVSCISVSASIVHIFASELSSIWCDYHAHHCQHMPWLGYYYYVTTVLFKVFKTSPAE